jgi:hypothetical protein
LLTTRSFFEIYLSMPRVSKFIHYIVVFFSLSVFSLNIYAQPQETLKPVLESWLEQCQLTYPAIGNLKLKKIVCSQSQKTISIYFNGRFSSIPFRPELNKKMKAEIDSVISPYCNGYKISLFADSQNIDELIPNYYRKEPDKKRLSKTNREGVTLVANVSKPYEVCRGLAGRNIALWQSHGWYYEPKLDRWEWQRARMFQTVEDKYTMSYVLPFLVPMLENAGAYVFMPRERDLQTEEVIVDNDDTTQVSIYRETIVNEEFYSGGSAGFAHKRDMYTGEQNPFAEGTYRVVRADKKNGAYAEWIPNIPKSGYYNVSIAYKSKLQSAQDVHYTLYHAGGKTDFIVNQTIGGGTWIYLGNFYFDAGINETHGKLVLSNLSKYSNKIVTADAARFGGGMGNIGRKPQTEELPVNVKSSSQESTNTVKMFTKDKFTVSGRARYLEGARYWLQWAGVPFSVYSKTEGLNDYVDDYSCRGAWVNFLNKGSLNQPDSIGLKIPIDLSFAFHSDAGTKTNDTIIGTLGIYTTKTEKKDTKCMFPNGQSRLSSRDLVDLVMTQITEDVRKVYEPNWTRRGMWDASYSETRTPEVPSMILELLSHQNFGDMKYGLDPRFQFLVSRAVYKSILRFLAVQNNTEYEVQPLPVQRFCAEIVADDSVHLKWQPTIDSLEMTAVSHGYVVYTRVAGKGFDNGIFVAGNGVTLPIEKNKIYSYKVTAVNGGGESFPSEILSVCKTSTDLPTLLIVNAFDRISAPGHFETSKYGGFADWIDQGVPYLRSISYIGAQNEMRIEIPWIDDDNPGFGASNSDYETTIVAGNTFDFPYIHGQSVVDCGYSFVSSSVAAVEAADINMEDYPLVDFIMGEQKKTWIGRGVNGCKFQTFSINLQNCISRYCGKGGRVFVSGAYVGTDLWDNGTVNSLDLEFAKNVLKYCWRTDKASQNGNVSAVFAPNSSFSGNYEFCTQLNERQYAVESPDGIEPYGDNAFTVFRYGQNNISAGVAYKDTYRTVVCGFPFESLIDKNQRSKFMYQVLNFLLK